MPARQNTAQPRITKFTNCRILKNNRLVEQDLWIDSFSGKILRDQEAFYELHLSPDQVINLQGRIVAPGFIDVQLNGAQGFDYSVPQATREEYDAGFIASNRGLIKTGVTSFLPTTVSTTAENYKQVLPSLAPTGARRPEDGAESLGAHVEGPFINPSRNGIHKPEVLLSSTQGFQDIIDCYGLQNIPEAKVNEEDTPVPNGGTNGQTNGHALAGAKPAIKMITAAPEVGHMTRNIRELISRGIIYSIGHSDATYEQAMTAVGQGATMITHLFNAMRPFYHRNPGVFGLLGQSDLPKPYFGVIADGIHLHPTSIKIAYNAHSEGLVLVTDAMRLCGLPDGIYDWTNGDRIIKKGVRLTLEGSDKIAGSSATLIECINNFRRWTGASTAESLVAATATPAKMLGMEKVKGTLDHGADADLVILGETIDSYSGPTLTVDQVWKFGVKVHDTADVVVSTKILA
ncbi:putative N-acetylglucosamine-6-phosphate deacetylase [Talaromyces proteolyticus]|uniref:N-acetylglucosamine-6-phosphate deacetylase n=1 Tax=Talaromyces proteolyticus TaxID=1131652 RepID=A0AAD4KGW4_9EURO|nr:putative N-acetylglucosamine-6-phosphate deacetylase [Talaromyces proteolyticus]KAH8690845.1 putative N-acetylglucosamine-6-phosphate deacetylase [Talaromyces proteolyticus]